MRKFIPIILAVFVTGATAQTPDLGATREQIMGSPAGKDARGLVDHVLSSGRMDQHLDAARRLAEQLMHGGTNQPSSGSSGPMPPYTPGRNGIDLGALVDEAGDVQQQAAQSASLPPILVLASFSMPKDAIKAWIDQAARAGGVVILRGLANNSLKETTNLMAEVLGEGAERGGILIDSRPFTMFGVRAVPTIIVAQGPILPCLAREPGCPDLPAFDLVRGNIPLESALHIVVREGEAGRWVAQQALSQMRGRP
jgi:conjugal transfer pilus assembly protein TrbC